MKKEAVALAGAKWFFWSEAFAPDWRAWVDSKPAPIHQAFGFFMAVPLGTGSGTVEFRYEPTAFRLGSFLFLCAVFAGVVLGSRAARLLKVAPPSRPDQVSFP
jgi:uncharacterized membrane protein YfhO